MLKDIWFKLPNYNTAEAASATAPPAGAPPPAPESDELTPQELASLEAYRLNTPPPVSSTPNVVTSKEDGKETVVETRPAEKPDPDEVTLQNGELVDQSGKKVPKVVPHGALHSEREGHKATKRQLEETKTQLSLIMELLQKSQTPPSATPSGPASQTADDPFAEPDIDVEKSGDILGALAQMQRRQRAMTQAQLKQTADTQATNQLKTVMSTYSADAARVRQADPTWNDAYAHYEASVRARYEAMGVEGADLDKAVQLDELNVVRSAIARKASPAEMIKKLAVAAGFRAGASPAPAPALPTPNPAAVAAIQAAAAGQQANASLGDLAGKAGEGMTGARVAEMSTAEFDRLYDKLERENPAELQRLLNGTYR